MSATATTTTTTKTNTIDDEWTLVTAADKKRVMRKRTAAGVGRSIRRPTAATVRCPTTSTSSIQDLQVLERCLEECIAYLRQTCFWKRLVEALPKIHLEQIVCYGIGNFSATGATYFAPGLWQLACAVALQRHQQNEHAAPPPRMRYYDPCASAWEIQWVRQVLGMTVPEHNERGNYPVASTPTLFFMPHCPARLYENVVWSNYYECRSDSQEAAAAADSCAARAVESNVWILGNSPRRIAETNHCPCLRIMMEWEPRMEVSMEPTRKDCDEAPGNLMAAFNDTYLIRLPGSSVTRPPRPYHQLLPPEEDGELI